MLQSISTTSVAIKLDQPLVADPEVMRDFVEHGMGEDLPPFVRATNGRVYRSRHLTYDQRRKRDKRIRLALELGFSVRWIRENMHVSNGVIWQVSKRTPHRRKVHRYSQRAWKNRGDLATG